MKLDDDESHNDSANPHFDDVLAQRYGADARRRRLLRGGVGAATLSFLGGAATVIGGCGGGGSDVSQAPPPAASGVPGRPSALGFAAVAKSRADSVTVPAGYTAHVLYRVGDPIASGIGAYGNDGSDAAASFASRSGDHHDGMHFFGLGADGRFNATASDRGLLCVNHESGTMPFLHPNGQTTLNGVRVVPEEVWREFYVHGVSVVELQRGPTGDWSYRQDSPLNRRIHAATEVALSGPAAGTGYMVTRHAPDGRSTRGTVNNCACGFTPWGTYLTCEENWAGYFRRDAATDNGKRSAKEITALNRYGVAGSGNFGWSTVTPDSADQIFGRWNANVLGITAADDYRNVHNTFGWVVEIDPFDPAATPKKRTALGRFAHEGAWPALVEPGKPLVFYMGCDTPNEYIYKFVSTRPWDPADARGGLLAGDKYLDDGKLYAARFDADGTGTWLDLSFGAGEVTAAYAAYSFADAADALIHARLAADARGATKMDRPEWGAVDPLTGAAYMTLTNNGQRTLGSTDAANPRHYNDPRSNGAAQRGNPNGHIIRWLEDGGSPVATTFRWDIFLFGARANADAAQVNLSQLAADNDFSSPDGLWFSRATGICWIETDDSAYSDVTNCMLLAALPGRVGDGSARSIVNTDVGGATRAVTTYVGEPPGNRLRRFLVGPVDCEITGLTETPDGRTLFVNIQHPGQGSPASGINDPATYTSHWPHGDTARPRSGTLAITRDDGGVIGV